MSTPLTSVARFKMGRIVSTPNALERLSGEDILLGLKRHQAGDWGDVEEHDRQANDRALEDGSRLLSIYHSSPGIEFWIITESDRLRSTILLPEDY